MAGINPYDDELDEVRLLDSETLRRALVEAFGEEE